MVKVTCIIPCHNHAHTVVRAVESALPQVDSVIVIDDVSNDNPRQAIHEAIGDNPKVVVIYTQAIVPAGVCHARNLGITMAGSGLILPLDADDYLEDGAVDKMRAAWQPDTFVYGNWIELTKKGETLQTPPPATMIRKKNIGFATFLFHRRDWLRAAGYKPNFNIGGEHWGFMATLWIRYKVKPIYIDEVIFYYDRLNGTRFRDANSYQKTIARLIGDSISGY